MSSQLSVLSKLCIMNTLLHFLLLFQFCSSLRNICLSDCILGKSNVIITVGWLRWRHQRAPFLVLPRAPPTLNPPLLKTIHIFENLEETIAWLPLSSCGPESSYWPISLDYIDVTQGVMERVSLQTWSRSGNSYRDPFLQVSVSKAIRLCHKPIALRLTATIMTE